MAIRGWRKISPEARIALCLEMAMQLYDRNFEMAHSVMHVAGQSYTQAFSGSGPNGHCQTNVAASAQRC